jgi:geranylgeranyl pyrophosphate synthase
MLKLSTSELHQIVLRYHHPQDDPSTSIGVEMDLFSQVIRAFTFLPQAVSWRDAEKMFQVSASRKPNHWLIPVRAYEAVGGLQEQAIPAILAVGCAHVSILLVDDMLDDDRRGDFHRIGMPAASNLACFFQAAALQAVFQCSPDPAVQSIAVNSFNQMFLSTAFGQFLDVQTPGTESAYWEVAKIKSSPFFGAALHLGALAGGAAPDVAGQLKTLGCVYGEMIQIHDDMHDSMETPANPDWIQGRSPLPILFASIVQHPEQKRFLDLKERVSSPEALREAQEILIQCGAISYCADQLIRKYEMGKEILHSIPLSNENPIASLLEEVIAPVQKLLEAGDVRAC